MIANIATYTKELIGENNDFCTFVLYKHLHNGITVMLTETSATRNDMEAYVSHNHEDYYDSDPVAQAFNAIHEYITIMHPEYNTNRGFTAWVYNPLALINGDAIECTDYRIKHLELLCKREHLAVGDIYTNGNYQRFEIAASHRFAQPPRYPHQGYPRWRIVGGGKRELFECDPEQYAQWNSAYNAWIWKG